ncbi:MAG TPA: type II toxin-antitoxin system PemK/MazF family toxin [Pseudobdellovibrionaceae bacterium]
MTMTTYKPFDVIELPFPFSDLSSSKKRKALVLSSEEFNVKNKATTVLMITSRANSEWAGDIQLDDWNFAGLKKPCYARLKIFTADNDLILNKVGSLSQNDIKKAIQSFRKYLPVF